MNVKEISDKFGVSIDTVMCEVKRGVGIEEKYTNSKQIALRNALDNISDDLTYYSKMDRLDGIIKKAKNKT